MTPAVFARVAVTLVIVVVLGAVTAEYLRLERVRQLSALRPPTDPNAYKVPFVPLPLSLN